jgi:flagellar biosynthesis/type III secretory pathway M-ring protein FliF/YscJ
MSDKEAGEINQLIAFAAGIGTEDIALSNMVFYDLEEPAVPVDATGPFEGIQLKELLIYGGIALIAISILLIILILVLRKRKKKRALDNAAITSDADSSEYSWADIQDGIKVQETEEQAIKKQLKDFTKTNPEIVSQLIRTWIKGDE